MIASHVNGSVEHALLEDSPAPVYLMVDPLKLLDAAEVFAAHQLLECVEVDHLCVLLGLEPETCVKRILPKNSANSVRVQFESSLIIWCSLQLSVRSKLSEFKVDQNQIIDD